MSSSEDDLIEVRKPASLLVAQFFLFPLIIIAICVGIFLLFGYLTMEQRSPKEYLSVIQTGSDSQRWQAAYELSASPVKGKMTPEFVGDLIKAYGNAKDPKVRGYLALALGHSGDKQAVPSLIEGLNDTVVENQINTLMALGFIGDNSAVPEVEKLLKHPEHSVRKVAALVLGALKDPSSIHDLQVSLNDSDEMVRWQAAMALAQMNDGSGAELLLKALNESPKQELGAFAQTWKSLVTFAPSPNASSTDSTMSAEQRNVLIEDAIKCLSSLKYEPARQKISELSRNDPSLEVRNAALEALKKY